MTETLSHQTGMSFAERQACADRHYPTRCAEFGCGGRRPGDPIQGLLRRLEVVGLTYAVNRIGAGAS